MIQFLKKIFCSHTYTSHAKKEYNWNETNVIPETRYWNNPLTETNEYSTTVEVLICSKCGKIKKIKY